MDDLRVKCEKEYVQETQQLSKELDTITARLARELDELQRYSLNEEKKLLASGREHNAKELKTYGHELHADYKRAKDEVKRELSGAPVSLSARERDEWLKAAKERLRAELRVREDTRRSQLEQRLVGELCALKRKHLLAAQRRELDSLVSVELGEQRTALAKTHALVEAHQAAAHAMRSRHLGIAQRRKRECMEREMSEEMANYKTYCERQRRELKKKHAAELKQHPKTLKQQQANIRKLYKHQYATQAKQFKTYREQVLAALAAAQASKETVRDKLDELKLEQNRKFSLLYEHYKVVFALHLSTLQSLK